MPCRLITVIATAGGNPSLRETLRSLDRCEKPSSYLKTIVIENGTQAGAEAIVTEVQHEHPALACEYLHAERANKSNALNECLATLDENYLLFMSDDDIEFDTSVLQAYAAVAGDTGGGVVYGGPIRVRKLGEAPEELKEFLPPSATGFPLREYREGDNFLGANWAAFSDDLKAAGGFDPRFGPGSPLTATGQESEMMRQLRRRGNRFQYVPEALVWHAFDAAGYSVDFLGRRNYRNGIEHGIRMRLRYEEGEKTPHVKDWWKSRLYTLLLPIAIPAVRMAGAKRLHAKLIRSLHGARGRKVGWAATKRENAGQSH